MPILKGAGNTLLCSCFAYGKWISTPAKSVNSEHRHAAFFRLDDPEQPEHMAPYRRRRHYRE